MIPALFLGITPPSWRSLSPDAGVALHAGAPNPEEILMAVVYEGGVLTKISKSHKAPKAAAANAVPAKSKRAKAADETPAPEKPPTLALVKDAPAAEAEAPAAAVPGPAAPTKSKRKAKSFDAELESVAKHAASLAGLCEAFVGKLRSDGKTESTVSAYRGELKLAMRHLGEATAVADLTIDQVRTYFESKPVTRLRSGRAKSPLSIDKTRRVLRLALLWAASEGWIKEAPVPEMPAAS